MNDYLKEVLNTARQVSGEILDTVEEKLRVFLDDEKEEEAEKPVDYQELYLDMVDVGAALEEELETLTEELYEARLALKLFMDGETKKTFDVSPTLSDSLSDYLISTHWESNQYEDLTLVVKQYKS